MLFYFFIYIFTFLIVSTYLSLSITHIFLIFPLILTNWFLTNKGNLLIAILVLEGVSASVLPIILLFSGYYNLSSMIIFLFITVMVCEACMGLACLISSIRNKDSAMTRSNFFIN